MNRTTADLLLLTLLLSISANADAAEREAKLSGVLNLNGATAEQLDLLPGIGPKAAERIIAFRRRRAFERPEELVQVKGFGKRRFNRLRSHLTVRGETTLTRADLPAPGEQNR